MSIWLSYSTWETAQHHLTEAAALGAVLAAGFLLALFQLLMGLIVGGRWRQMPTGWSWSFTQKIAMVSNRGSGRTRMHRRMFKSATV